MRSAPLVRTSHVGYLCGARKRFVLSGANACGFDIRDVSREQDGRVAFHGTALARPGAMGDHAVGDFSALRRPGLYRVTVPGEAACSYPFLVADGAYARLPRLFLDYLHSQRCGDFSDELRGPCHLDDGVRSDTGTHIDAAGGWHDAGDLRKRMATTPLPVLGLFEARRRLGIRRSLWREKPWDDDLLSEAAWCLSWMLKMQDPASGMFHEDVGGGGESGRTPGTLWWHENHAGSYADNADNRFTDNISGSGDERRVRVQYNPVVQYEAVVILLEASVSCAERDPAFARRCREAAVSCWGFMKEKRRDEYHGWTSVLSWRLLAAMGLHERGLVAESEVAALVSVLLDLQSEAGFWFMDARRSDPYRGVLHSAQPVIALCAFIESDFAHPLAAQAKGSLERFWGRTAAPLLAGNPYGIMPYGLYFSPPTEGDRYHEWKDDMVYRFFMPADPAEGMVHGLSSHWTSWAHGLALLGRILEERECTEAAFDQLHWLLGANPLGVSMVSGAGYAEPTACSRFLGRIPGGFSGGPRGTVEDTVTQEAEGSQERGAGEYWSVPLGNALMALSLLLPAGVEGAGRLGAAV